MTDWPSDIPRCIDCKYFDGGHGAGVCNRPVPDPVRGLIVPLNYRAMVERGMEWARIAPCHSLCGLLGSAFEPIEKKPEGAI